MLVKGKRTYDSFMNAIALHLSSGDWEEVEDDPDVDIEFGPEWIGRVNKNRNEHVESIELFHEEYSDAEMLVVEKAIGLMEGLEWEKAVTEEPAPRSRKRKNGESRDERGDMEE